MLHAITPNVCNFFQHLKSMDMLPGVSYKKFSELLQLNTLSVTLPWERSSVADLISKPENLRIAFKEIKVLPSHGEKFKCKHSFGIFLKKLRHDIKPHLLCQSPI